MLFLYIILHGCTTTVTPVAPIIESPEYYLKCNRILDCVNATANLLNNSTCAANNYTLQTETINPNSFHINDRNGSTFYNCSKFGNLEDLKKLINTADITCKEGSEDLRNIFGEKCQIFSSETLESNGSFPIYFYDLMNDPFIQWSLLLSLIVIMLLILCSCVCIRIFKRSKEYSHAGNDGSFY